MTKREFVCMAAIELWSEQMSTDEDCWADACALWEARPQWMKDEEADEGDEESLADVLMMLTAARGQNAMPPPAAWPNGNPGASAPGC